MLLLVFLVFLTVVVVSIGVVVLMWWLGDAKPNTLLFEIAKDVLQVDLVLAAGTMLSLLSYEYQQQRQDADRVRSDEQRRKEYRQDLLKVTLARATVSYNDVKRARRLLRARAGTGPVIEAEHYDTHLAAINDAQLEFEMLTRDVETSGSAFADAAALTNELENVQKYLYRLVAEYENHRSEFVGKPEQLKAQDLPVLQGFLSHLREEPTHGFNQVQRSFRKVQQIIRQDLLTDLMIAEARAVAGEEATEEPRDQG